ncbi:MAG: DNA-directed RNA polymerase subunit omega [Candidatus Eisenbacteria bacterium]|nr:DNA-directed RNA polymerase subunit omega [Candidatus Eisenbacteria bacterium]
MKDKRSKDKARKKEEDRMEASGGNTVSSFPNKYEAAIIAAKEAKRINEIMKISGEDPKVKVTLTAIDRVAKGKVKFAYGEPEGRR